MGTPVTGNDEVERYLVLVEMVANSKGLPPDSVSVMLEFAMSLRMGKKAAVAVILRHVPDILYTPVKFLIESLGHCSKTNLLILLKFFTVSENSNVISHR